MFSKTSISRLLVALFSVALLLPPATPAQAAPGNTIRISVASDGAQGNGRSYDSSISADGRYVAFTSYASNLVSGDTNGRSDVFMRDNLTNTTTLISMALDGTPGHYDSNNPSISADGRYVAFDSLSSNLTSGDANGCWDVFVRDTLTNTTTLISVASDGTQGDDQSVAPSISADGRYVAFESYTTNLVVGDTNWVGDVFVRDTLTNTTTRVSVAPDGTQMSEPSTNPAISADGRYVAFEYARPMGCLPFCDISADVVSSINNPQVFVRDTLTNTTSLVSVNLDGGQAKGDSYLPSISADGRYVAFESAANDLVSGDTMMPDVFVRDALANTTTRVSVAWDGGQTNGYSDYPSISADGRYVAFMSLADNLVSVDTNWRRWDVFVRDTLTNITTLISVASDGIQENDDSFSPSISADGRYVAFDSDANNLVRGDTNGVRDVFVHERGLLPVSVAVKSFGAQDGWILETSEKSNQGGKLDVNSTVFRLGDDNLKKQYRGILSFGTGASLPDNAAIAKVTLKIRPRSIPGGGDPVLTFQGFMVDVKQGYFGLGKALEAADFQAALRTTGKTCGPFNLELAGGWYSLDLTAAKDYINRQNPPSGLTQIRLRFKLDDNNDAKINWLILYSGNAPAASKPQLVVQYYVP